MPLAIYTKEIHVDIKTNMHTKDSLKKNAGGGDKSDLAVLSLQLQLHMVNTRYYIGSSGSLVWRRMENDSLCGDLCLYINTHGDHDEDSHVRAPSHFLYMVSFI